MSWSVASWSAISAASSTTTTTTAAATVAAATTATAAAWTAIARAAVVAISAAFALLAAFTGGRAHWLRVTLAKLLHRFLAAQLDAARVVDQDHLDLHLVADVHEIRHAIDISIRKLRHVAQAIGLRRDLDERPEFLDRNNPAVVDLPDLHLGGHRFDDVAAALGGFAVHGADVNGAVVFDVDVGAGVGLQRFDVLAARANDLADLFRIDLD